MSKPPQLDPGGDAGKRKAEQGPQRHIAVSVDDSPRNPRHPGQRPHRSGAGDISRNAQDGAYDKNNEARSLHDDVVHDERGNVEEEREHEADGREVIQDDVDMRPGLRSSLRRRVQSQFVVIDLPANLSRDDHQGESDKCETQDKMECIVGHSFSAPGAPKLDQGGRGGQHEQGERRDPPTEVDAH